MKHPVRAPEQDDLLQPRLVDMIDMRHELVNLARVSKLLHQAPKSKGKIYAPHEPEVDCISKGKARVR